MWGRRSTWGSCIGRNARFPEAVDAFRRALAGAPFNATAAYGLANTLVLAGTADEGREAMARFQKLSESGYAVTYSQTYLEQGRYAEAIVSTGAEAPLVDTRTPPHRVHRCHRNAAGAAQGPLAIGERRRSSPSISTATAISISSRAARPACGVYRNERRAFADVTATLLGDTAARTRNLGSCR